MKETVAIHTDVEELRASQFKLVEQIKELQRDKEKQRKEVDDFKEESKGGL